MAVRTTIDIPEPLHETLLDRAKALGTSVQALIIRAVEDVYCPPLKGEQVAFPLVTGGDLGPAFPTDETPHYVILP